MKADRKTILRLGGGIFILFLLIYYWSGLNELLLGVLSAAMPLAVGFFMAYILNILMSFYERHFFPTRQEGALAKGRRAICLLLAMASLLLILVGIAVLIVPELSSSIQLLAQEIPEFWREAVTWVESNVSVEQWAALEALLGDISADFNGTEMLQQFTDWLMTGFGGVMGTMAAVISRAFSTTIAVLVGMIFAIYLLYSKEKLAGQLNRIALHYMREKWYKRVRYVLSVLDRCFHSFIVGQCLEAVILGVLCILGMMLLRFPYATMIGTLIGFTALIPVAGAYIGAFVGAFLIFTVSPVQALLFLIFIVILQQVEGNLIYPKVVGASIGLPGVWVLAAITVGGGIMGIGGMLLGVPLAAAIYHILRDDMNSAPMRDPPEGEPDESPEGEGEPDELPEGEGEPDDPPDDPPEDEADDEA